MKFLFLKRALNYPRSSGHDVHTFEIARSLAALGHDIGFATVNPLNDAALTGLKLSLGWHSLHSMNQSAIIPNLTWLQRRFLRFWGIDANWMDSAGKVAKAVAANVVVASGFDVLPCLAAVHGPMRVWYAADEYATRHWSMLRLTQTSTWRNLFEAVFAAMYERSYAGYCDRVWVVSDPEARSMRRIGGAKVVDVVPNGVDGEHFHPGYEPKINRSCVFWGRLDAGPNIQAVDWFVRRVWPDLRRRFPEACFSVYGFAPTEAVLKLAGNGVSVIGNIPDLRADARRHEVVVMPFVSGGGIKNKLLEAAAMGLPIVASPSGCAGLDARAGLPLIVASRPGEWVEAVSRLWSDATCQSDFGGRARAWVLERHSWLAAAQSIVRNVQ